MRSSWALWAAVVALLHAAAPVFAQPPTSQRALSGRGGAAVADPTALDMARRQELIPQILDAREAASSRGMSPQLRGALAGLLASVPAPSLEAFDRVGGLGDIEALVRSTAGPRVLGDTGADLVFTPVTPCRIIDTTIAGGPIAGGATRNFFVNGNTAGTFETQGGTPGGCGIPDEATAVEMNFVAVGPAGPGDFRAFPWSLPPTVPNASIINYASLPGLNIANGLAQPVCNAAVTVCTFDLIVQADVSAAHLVVDVVGFYRRVDTSAVKSFVTLAIGSTSGTADTCANSGGLNATITAPVAGKVVLNATVTVNVIHTTGNTAELDFAWGTSPVDCATGAQFIKLPAAMPSSTEYFFPLADVHVFSVAAGTTTTFFFNSTRFVSGGDGMTIRVGSKMTATFIPD
jgi:hypothetical protein